MAEGDTTTTTTTTTPPWHNGVEADTLGFWQNKGYDVADPKALATKLTEQYRAAEKHIGAPPDRILRLPEKPDDLAGWDAVHQRLGTPKEAKEYEFTGLKHADGKDVDPALADALRAALFTARVAKDRGGDVVKAVVKSLDDRAAAEATVAAGKLAEEKAALEKSWGPNYQLNRLKAMEGAKRANMSPEAVELMERQLGFSAVMEHFRRVGVGTSEDMWREGGGGGNPTTLEGAQQRLTELQKDPAWGKRLRANDAATVAEWRALTTQIAAAA